MSKQIEISEQDYERIRQAAAEAGMPLEEWLIANLPLNGNGAHPAAAAAQPCSRDYAGKTMADLFKGYVGLIDSGGDGRLSENTGERFASLLVEEHKAGLP